MIAVIKDSTKLLAMFSFAMAAIAWTPALKARPSMRVGIVDDQIRWIDRRADFFMSDLNQRELIVSVNNSDDMLLQLEQGLISSFLGERKRVIALQNKLKNPKDFEIIAQSFLRIPQAFVIGSMLDRPSQDAINIAISELKFDGEIESILERWKTP